MFASDPRVAFAAALAIAVLTLWCFPG